jgi:hypothetical protein
MLAGNPLKPILRSRMVLFDGVHQEHELVGEKVLLSVTLGEPKIQKAISNKDVAFFAFQKRFESLPKDSKKF